MSVHGDDEAGSKSPLIHPDGSEECGRSTADVKSPRPSRREPTELLNPGEATRRSTAIRSSLILKTCGKSHIKGPFQLTSFSV